MNARQAKRLRRLAYGDISSRAPREYTHTVVQTPAGPRSAGIRALGLRAVYQRLKKAYYRGELP